MLYKPCKIAGMVKHLPGKYAWLLCTALCVVAKRKRKQAYFCSKFKLKSQSFNVSYFRAAINICRDFANRLIKSPYFGVFYSILQTFVLTNTPLRLQMTSDHHPAQGSDIQTQWEDTGSIDNTAINPCFC